MRDALSKLPAPAVASAEIIAPFPAHLARPSNIPRFADAQVAPPREETLVEELNRVLTNIGRLSAPQECI